MPRPRGPTRDCAGNGHGGVRQSGVAGQHRRRTVRATILAFGGVDVVINSAAIYPTPIRQRRTSFWTRTLDINVTGNYVLADEAAVLKVQNLPARDGVHRFGEREGAQRR